MGETVLVIDDDPDILQVLKANLELHRYAVRTAGSWTEAKKVIGAGLPHLIILDLTLPDGDGTQICRMLRKSYPSLPIIMLTARDTVSDKVIGLESGADDYVVKPFETLELLARIRACLRRARPPGSQIITAENISMDLKRRIVTVRGREITLTPKEYDLLRLLMSERGTAMSREEIKRHLWKEERIYSWSRVIDVHIQHLRQKIEANPAEPRYILTVPGVGYRFRE